MEKRGTHIPKRTALLLIAHGSRQAEANADLEHVAAELRARDVGDTVVCSYLEQAQPDIDAGAARCVAEHVDEVVLIPYFLSAGVHVTRDLQAARDRLAASFPRVTFRLSAPIGRHPLIVEIIAQRAAETANLANNHLKEHP